MYLVCILLSVLVLLGLLENFLHRRRLLRIPLRILVNGTRGKTTVTRMIYGALRSSGYRVMARTTGSEAQTLLPDGSIIPFIRKIPARITEMIPFIRLCSKNDVNCIVVECMALVPENQRVIARSLVRPTHVVMTNTYIDHIVEMGDTLDETAWALAQSIPQGCQLFTIDEYYDKVDCNIHQVQIHEYGIVDAPVPIHDANASLVVGFCQSLGIDEATVLASLKDLVPDIGLQHDFIGPCGARFVPSFSVNDLHCMQAALLQASSSGPVSIIFNNRKDREYRIKLLDMILKEYGDLVKSVWCIGDYPKKVARHVFHRSRLPSKAVTVQELYNLICAEDSREVFVGLGNIKGAGEELVRRCMEEGACCPQQ